ncbi:MAG: YceI family protein [Bacteroidia bacterium]
MKISSILSVFVLFLSLQLSAQDLYFTKTAKVTLDATPENPVEEIEAINNEATSFLNKSTGDLVFAVLVKSFRFQKALMEEHFNENYLESNKFPKSDFKGKITDIASVNFDKDGTYPVTVEGKLTMHGVTQTVSAKGEITVSGGKFSAKAKFTIQLSDYKVERPGVVKDKISETATIEVDAKYELKK